MQMYDQQNQMYASLAELFKSQEAVSYKPPGLQMLLLGLECLCLEILKYLQILP